MTALAIIDTAIPEYKYLFCGIVFLGSFFAILLGSLFAGWIWTHISHRLGTTKPTYVRFKVENWQLSLVEHSNIYKVPHTKLLDLRPSKAFRRYPRLAIAKKIAPRIRLLEARKSSRRRTVN